MTATATATFIWIFDWDQSILSPQEHKDVLSLKSIDLTVGGPEQLSILSSCCANQE